MDIPESMKADLAAWNGGSGIDLESWIGCVGQFSLAVGYASVFWPRFERHGPYILRVGSPEEVIRGFESQRGSTPQSVEAVLNHLHLADIQHAHCEDISPDKLAVLGDVLREIYTAKLAWQFPNAPCEVHLYLPEDPGDLIAYQITFWQRKWAEG
jgi:hypothetical protein